MNNRLHFLHYFVHTHTYTHTRKEMSEYKVKGSPFNYSFWHNLSVRVFTHLNVTFIYQGVLDISVLKSKFLMIKMVTIDSWDFMTVSRCVFPKRFYASLILWLTRKKVQPINQYCTTIKNTNTALHVMYDVRTKSNLAKIFSCLHVCK